MTATSHPLTFIDPVCGLPAYHRVRVPNSMDPILPHEHEHLDGSAVSGYDLFICESCRRAFQHNDFAAICDPKNWRAREAQGEEA